MKFILHIIIFILLTILTQIGGLVYLISLIISKKWAVKFRFKTSVVFSVRYILSVFVLVPILAPVFGREKIINTESIKPTSYITILLNRNYVKPVLNTVLSKASKKLEGTSIQIHYLDANFPFINKFPLLPHLSHNDGKKLDISLVYQTNEGDISNLKKSNSGYGVFVVPKPNEINQTKKCIQSGYFQYDYPKYLTLGSINANLTLSEHGTKTLINALLTNKTIGKVFIEPHLKQRMNLTDSRIRFHGCKAVRHDDHIHIQLK